MTEETPSEKVQAKAAEYLLSGRVKVQYLANDGLDVFLAHLTPPDGGDPYHVKFNRTVGWRCDCPARVDVCAHILACKTIVALDAAPDLEPRLGQQRDPSIDALLGD